MESYDPDRMAEYQSVLLRDMLARCRTVPYYRAAFRAAGVDPGDIRGVADVGALPFMGKEQLRELQPWGMLGVPLERVARFHATSGTTGPPCNVGFTANDLDALAELGARHLTAFGVGQGDIAWQSYAYGLWIGGSALDRAYERLGVTAIPAGPGRTGVTIERLRDLGCTTISCTPSFALLLAERAAETGITPKEDWKLRVGVFGGEPLTRAAQQRLAEVMPPGFRTHNTYGTTELGGPFVAASCEYSLKRRESHVWSDHYLIEIIDPVTGEPITEPGVPGELVITTLQREASPMLRWRTRDLTAWASDAWHCPCGRRAHPKISWVSGRSDDILKIRGTLVLPSQVEDVISQHSAVGDGWQLVVDKDPDGLRATEAAVYAEARPEAWPQQADRIQQELSVHLADRLGLRLAVHVMPPSCLPRYEGKAKRVLSSAEFHEAVPAARRATGTAS